MGPIGIFDSGYGGLTILHGIRQLLPEYDYLYLGDNARAPYGPRSFDVVYEFTRQAVVKLFEMGCHLVILGCNTASAKALRTIQQHDIPKIDPERRVLGVIRPTAEVIGSLTHSRHVGVLATEGTIKSESYNLEIQKLHPDIVALGHEMTAGHQGNMSVNINGERCLVSYQPVPGTNWSLALVCPERSILWSYNRLGFIIGPLIIIGLLLILFFCFTIVTQAIRPLNKLANKIQRIAEGHFDELIKKTHYTDALGTLQNSFQAMQESINRHMDDIQKMNDESARRNEELVHTSKLAEEASKQKSLFIQNVSHQVRTPLNIIMGFAQVLHESKSALPYEEAKSITDMMKHNSMMLERMSLMLFDSSARGTTEELYANKNEEIYCNETVRECLAEILENYPSLPVTFESDVPDDFTIHTNSLYLKRSIRELIYNAVKYADGKRIVIRIQERASKIRFVIEDTGPGIPEDYRDLMFESFTKVNDLSEGLGLGLPLAKRHMRNLGGDLILDEKYKDGCRFIIELPKK